LFSESRLSSGSPSIAIIIPGGIKKVRQINFVALTGPRRFIKAGRHDCRNPN
jgi:hypothetical protein